MCQVPSCWYSHHTRTSLHKAPIGSPQAADSWRQQTTKTCRYHICHISGRLSGCWIPLFHLRNLRKYILHHSVVYTYQTGDRATSSKTRRDCEHNMQLFTTNRMMTCSANQQESTLRSMSTDSKFTRSHFVLMSSLQLFTCWEVRTVPSWWWAPWSSAPSLNASSSLVTLIIRGVELPNTLTLRNFPALESLIHQIWASRSKVPESPRTPHVLISCVHVNECVLFSTTITKNTLSVSFPVNISSSCVAVLQGLKGTNVTKCAVVSRKAWNGKGSSCLIAVYSGSCPHTLLWGNETKFSSFQSLCATKNPLEWNKCTNLNPHLLPSTWHSSVICSFPSSCFLLTFANNHDVLTHPCDLGGVSSRCGWPAVGRLHHATIGAAWQNVLMVMVLMVLPRGQNPSGEM